ncbi:MAG: hypothetical protein JSW68_03830, partial [Burkholderiales bacterium]
MGHRHSARSAAPAGLGFALGAALLQRLPELPPTGGLVLLGCVGIALLASGVAHRRWRVTMGWAEWCAWVALGFVWAGSQARIAVDDRLA